MTVRLRYAKRMAILALGAWVATGAAGAAAATEQSDARAAGQSAAAPSQGVAPGQDLMTAYHILAAKRFIDLTHSFGVDTPHWKGFGVTEIPVEHHARKYGRSKFGAGRLLKGLIDFVKVMFLTRYMSKPLHLFAPTGLLLFFVGIVLLLELTREKLFAGQHLFDRPALLLGVLLVLMGVQLVSTGLLGEMIRNASYDRREEFSVRERLG